MMKDDLLLTPQVKADIFKHAYQLASLSPPQEMVGIISKGCFHPLENLSDDPVHSFAIDQGNLDQFDQVDAIVHSHPGGPHHPSHHDMQQQIASGIPWVIAVVPDLSMAQKQQHLTEDIFIFGTSPALNLDQGYRHGVHDCYALIRGFYHDHMKLELPDIPRGWDWWHEGADLYVEGFAPLGFELIPKGSALMKGDIFLAQIRAPVINHGGIWLGDGLILHHLAGRQGYQPERYPQQEPAERWQKFIRLWIRHKSITL